MSVSIIPISLMKQMCVWTATLSQPWCRWTLDHFTSTISGTPSSRLDVWPTIGTGSPLDPRPESRRSRPRTSLPIGGLRNRPAISRSACYAFGCCYVVTPVYGPNLGSLAL